MRISNVNNLEKPFGEKGCGIGWNFKYYKLREKLSKKEISPNKKHIRDLNNNNKLVPLPSIETSMISSFDGKVPTFIGRTTQDTTNDFDDFTILTNN